MQFGLPFWILTGNATLFAMTAYPYVMNNSVLLESEFKLTESMATNLRALPYLIGAVLAPFFGYFSDRYGKKGIWLIVSSAIIFTCPLITIILMR